MNWVVIGVGDIAVRRVIPAIQSLPQSCLYGLITRNPAKAKPYKCLAWSELAEPLRDPAVDAVYVATPVFLHASQTVQALRAGKHVLCEKPMAMNTTESRTMLDAAAETGRTLGVAYYRRTYPKVARARQLLKSGAIGLPLVAELTSHGWFDGREFDGKGLNRSWLLDPAQAGGGPLFDIASHRIDVLNYLFGQPQRVTGQVSNSVHHYPVEDNATLLIEYSGGVRGIVDVRWNSKVKRDECRIRGTEGEIDLTPLNGPELRSPDGHEHLDPHPNLHYPMIENFEQAVLGKSPPLASGESSYWTDWVIEQVRQQNGR
jgi:1,5-anhydro-D-fructose reductase (1,5-anhydro-D-mannitol-forming)